VCVRSVCESESEREEKERERVEKRREALVSPLRGEKRNLPQRFEKIDRSPPSPLASPLCLATGVPASDSRPTAQLESKAREEAETTE
jgi:hypothetical protein